MEIKAKGNDKPRMEAKSEVLVKIKLTGKLLLTF
jgi:hypothetical protein